MDVINYQKKSKHSIYFVRQLSFLCEVVYLRTNHEKCKKSRLNLS